MNPLVDRFFLFPTLLLIQTRLGPELIAHALHDSPGDIVDHRRRNQKKNLLDSAGEVEGIARQQQQAPLKPFRHQIVQQRDYGEKEDKAD